jgi:uncharacterized membrane protein YfcA
MLTIKTWLFLALGGFAVFYLIAWLTAILKSRRDEKIAPTALGAGIGFVTTFFDTLGIGSFATTTSLFKLRHVVRDERIPGTLNVGITPPTIIQAFIFIAIVDVDMLTLILLIAASVLGMWLGAGVVCSWPRRKVQIGMGIALLLAAALTLLQVLNVTAGAGAALRLTGTKLALGFIGNFVLGALMSLGIGLYGPCLIMISLLGMNPTAAFPIMMGSCAFLMPVGSVRFIRKGSYDLRAALGLALGGIPAVLIAVYIVKSLPLIYVRWLVIVVVVYTSVMMLRSAMTEKEGSAMRSVPRA